MGSGLPGERWIPHTANGFSKQRDVVMKTRSHAADYYRRILLVQPHALKRLDALAMILHCHRGQEIPNNSGPAGHWYYVITGAVRRGPKPSGGPRPNLDLIVPRELLSVLQRNNECSDK